MISKYPFIPLFRTLIFFFISSFLCLSYANNNPQQEADIALKALYHSMNNMPNFDMPARLDKISSLFLNRPYILGALGEGANARYDQSPLYRTDGFDCETLVTTVLAIALADNQDTFKQCINKLRYADGNPGFTRRHHFTSLDWNLNNQRLGFVKDITESITDAQHKPVAEMAIALIDKPSWYQHFTPGNIKLQNATAKETEQRLRELKTRGSQLPRSLSKLAYLPFSVLFDANGKANDYLFAQIPDAAIIEIVRPNWDLRQQIGSCLNVSHLGFAFWKKDKLIFRQASSIYNKVVDVSLIDYLRDARNSPTIKGINVQIVLPQKPLTSGCIASTKSNM